MMEEDAIEAVIKETLAELGIDAPTVKEDVYKRQGYPKLGFSGSVSSLPVLAVLPLY